MGDEISEAVTPMNSFNWTCPYCGQPTTITDPNYHIGFSTISTVESKYEEVGMTRRAIACPNQDCKELYLEASLTKREYRGHSWVSTETIERWELMPRSRAKPWPHYIPEEIRSTYKEACLIQQDSPKSSAAASRRCLQGIVRDFWEIPNGKRGKLGAELSFIKEKVDSDTWGAIQAVRSVGDIGAHMDKDVNVIVDVHPDEARLLIELIETLLADWYVERHKRTERNNALRSVAAEKLQAKREGKRGALPIEDVPGGDE